MAQVGGSMNTFCRNLGHNKNANSIPKFIKQKTGGNLSASFHFIPKSIFRYFRRCLERNPNNLRKVLVVPTYQLLFLNWIESCEVTHLDSGDVLLSTPANNFHYSPIEERKVA